MKKIKGSCLCKKISFEIKNECRYSVFCHCQMCQASNAEFSSYTKVKKENLNFKSKKTLKWFVSSKHYKRGFCSICGSSLFFQKRSSDDYISISTGTLNKNIPTIGHIFYKYKKSKISFSKLKKFPQSAQGYFDKYIYRIK